MDYDKGIEFLNKSIALGNIDAQLSLLKFEKQCKEAADFHDLVYGKSENIVTEDIFDGNIHETQPICDKSQTGDQIREISLISVHDNIQALHYYHPYWADKANRIKNPEFDNNSSLILDLKNSRENAISHFVRELTIIIPENIVICIVPSSKVGYGDNASIGLIAKQLCNNSRIDGTKCLYRHTKIDKLAHGGSRQQAVHENSIEVRHIEIIKDKIIWLLDDVVTTGNSMKVCAKKLYDHKAKKVFCIAIGCTTRRQSTVIDNILF